MNQVRKAGSIVEEVGRSSVNALLVSQSDENGEYNRSVELYGGRQTFVCVLALSDYVTT